VGYRVLAAVVVAVHFAVLGYIVVGGFIALRWRRTIWAHFAAAAWALAIVTVPSLVCPLTTAENWARERGGYGAYRGGFINRYVENVIYPASLTPFVQALVAIAVLTSWFLVYRSRRPPSTAAQT
jgi:Protein of Unknown function (DUF2784)